MSMRLVFTMLLAAGLLLADGGTVLFHRQAGPFTITLLATPAPLRVGSADLSVLVENAAGSGPVMNAQVMVHLVRHNGAQINEVMAPATHARASNKLYYAADVTIPSAGVWRLRVEVKDGSREAEIAEDVTVLPPLPKWVAYWPYFALLPLVLILFVFNRWLRRKRQARLAPRSGR
jgi:hypothetical protein